MKSYTDLEQSKKLAEFLPIENADMTYRPIMDIDSMSNSGFLNIPECYPFNEFKDCNIKPLPCWSLAALLGVIPKPDLIQNSEGTWLVHSWVNAYPWSVGGYSNPIDACVAMIEKLHKINLI